MSMVALGKLTKERSKSSKITPDAVHCTKGATGTGQEILTSSLPRLAAEGRDSKDYSLGFLFLRVGLLS